MSSDFNSEFSRIWSSSACSISGWDWSESIAFDSTDSASCYSAEADLVSSLTSEAYSTYGFEVDYLVKEISTKRDKIFGEDPLENIIRRFRLDVYAEELPKLSKSYQLQGMLYEEVVVIFATIAHFSEASQYTYDRSEIKYDIYTPKIGDLMYFKYSDKYYEIVNVKKYASDTTFLASPIIYTFTLRIWKNNHEDVGLKSQDGDVMPIKEFTDLAETFDLENNTSTVEANSDILAVNHFVRGLDTKDPWNPEEVMIPSGSRVRDMSIDDPFNGW